MESTGLHVPKENARGSDPEVHLPTLLPPWHEPLMGEARIVIGDPQPVLLEGLSSRLQARSLAWKVVAIAGSEPTLLSHVQRLRPDIVVVDIALGEDPDPGIVGRIRAAHDRARILVFTDREIPSYAEQAFRAGALAVVSKSDPLNELDRALEAIRSGKRYASLLVAAHLLTSWYGGESVPPFEHAIGVLSERELHVFRMMGEGKGTKEVAAKLGVSVKTVETYQARIAVKIGQRGAARVRTLARFWLNGKNLGGSRNGHPYS